MVSYNRATEDWMLERMPSLKGCKRIPFELLDMAHGVLQFVDMSPGALLMQAIERQIEFSLRSYAIFWAEGLQGYEDGPH